MRAPDLDDVRECAAAILDRVQQALEGGNEAAVDLFGRGDVHDRREGVVGALAAIDVIVGMDRVLGAKRPAQDLDRPVGDHLVGVHVGLGSRTGLPDHQREVVVEASFDDLVGGPDDGVGDARVELSQRLVDECGRLLLDSKRADHRLRHGLGADGEVLETALGLGAPVPVRGNRDLAQAVVFDALGGHESCSVIRSGDA